MDATVEAHNVLATPHEGRNGVGRSVKDCTIPSKVTVVRSGGTAGSNVPARTHIAVLVPYVLALLEVNDSDVPSVPSATLYSQRVEAMEEAPVETASVNLVHPAGAVTVVLYASATKSRSKSPALAGGSEAVYTYPDAGFGTVADVNSSITGPFHTCGWSRQSP